MRMNVPTRPLRAFLAMPLAVLMLSAAGVAYAKRVEMPAGTVIPAVLDQRVSSRTARIGDRVTATVRNDNPYYASIPDGTRIEGVVRDVSRATSQQPGMVDLSFRRIMFPDGQTKMINSRLVGLDSVERTASGRIIAKGKPNKTLESAGIGAVGGLVLGALLKKPLEGAIIGAVAGVVYGETNKSKKSYSDVDLRAGTGFGVQLDRRLTFNAPNRGEYARDRMSLGYGSARGMKSTVRGSDDELTLILDGHQFSPQGMRPILEGNVAYIPMVPVLRALNAKYAYDSRDDRFTVFSGTRRTTGTIGASDVVVNNTRHTLRSEIRMMDGHLYSPVKFVSMATDAWVNYSPSRHTVFIESLGYRNGRDSSWR